MVHIDFSATGANSLWSSDDTVPCEMGRMEVLVIGLYKACFSRRPTTADPQQAQLLSPIKEEKYGVNLSIALLFEISNSIWSIFNLSGINSSLFQQRWTSKHVLKAVAKSLPFSLANWKGNTSVWIQALLDRVLHHIWSQWKLIWSPVQLNAICWTSRTRHVRHDMWLTHPCECCPFQSLTMS